MKCEEALLTFLSQKRPPFCRIREASKSFINRFVFSRVLLFSLLGSAMTILHRRKRKGFLSFCVWRMNESKQWSILCAPCDSRCLRLVRGRTRLIRSLCASRTYARAVENRRFRSVCNWHTRERARSQGCMPRGFPNRGLDCPSRQKMAHHVRSILKFN